MKMSANLQNIFIASCASFIGISAHAATPSMCPNSDVISVTEAAAAMERRWRSGTSTAGGAYLYMTSEQLRRGELPQFYVLRNEPEVVASILEERRSPYSIAELANDFHLGNMTQSVEIMRRVRQWYRVLDKRDVYENPPEPFLAPIIFLDGLASTYEGLYAHDSLMVELKFADLEERIKYWIGASRVAYSGGGSADEKQITAAWLYFHLAVLARKIDPRIPSWGSEEYFREAAKYVSPFCQPRLAAALQRLASNQPACTDGGTPMPIEKRGLERDEHPYFCALADPQVP